MCTCTCTLHSTALFSPFLHVLFSSKWLPDSEAELFPIESGTDNVTPPFHLSLSLSLSSLCCCRSFSRNHSYTVILDSLRPKRERESGLCLITSTRKCALSTSFVRIVRTCHKRHHKRNDSSSSSSRTTSAKEQKDTRKETPKRQSMTVKYVPPPLCNGCDCSQVLFRLSSSNQKGNPTTVGYRQCSFLLPFCFSAPFVCVRLLIKDS